MKTIKVSGKLDRIFAMRSKDNNAKVQITMTSWTKLDKFNLQAGHKHTISTIFAYYANYSKKICYFHYCPKLHTISTISLDFR